MIAFLVGIWLIILFPIPFLPLWGLPIDPTSIRTLLIITSIITIPFTLLAIFMNEGNSVETQLDDTALYSPVFTY
jgi:hypothetical protein